MYVKKTKNKIYDDGKKVLGDEILKSTMGQKGGVMFIMEHSLINHKIGALHARVHNGTKGWRHNGTSKGVP